MVKTLAAASVLAIAGTAVAAPFSIAGATLTGTADPGFGTNPGLYNFLGNPTIPGGNYGVAGFAGSGVEIGTTLIGAHPDVNPYDNGVDPDSSAIAGTLFVLTTEFSASDTSAFNVAFTFPAGEVTSGENDRIWLGQLFGNVTSFTAGLNTGGASAVNLTAGGGSAIDPVSGQPLELVLEPRGGTARGDNGFNAFVQVVPAPGAMALMGLAGVAGLRRRRA